jgi:putative Mn2+ efflux pump MntP
MTWLEMIAIAAGLAMDALAVSVAVAAAGWANDRAARFRLWFHFGLFQALMPVLGWLVGRPLAERIAAWDHWVALAVLAWIGARMVRSGLRDEVATDRRTLDPTRGRLLMGLAIATSLDALAVGFSFACLGVSVWRPALVIGVVAAAFSLAGCLAGERLGRVAGRRLEVAGGVVLILVGVRIAADQVLGGG